MAQSIPDPGGTSYYVSFTDGQGGGAGTYTQYAQHMDVNFILIRNVVNQLVQEIGALQGPNASLVLDLLQRDDPGETSSTDGVIGEHSYLCTIGSPTSEVDVQGGSALVLGEKVTFAGPANIECGAILGGSPTTGYVALSATGEPSVETDPLQESMDIYSITWNGTIITALTRLTDPASNEGPILMDADAWYRMQNRVASLAFGAFEFPTPADRFEAIERMLSGYGTDLLGGSVGPLLLDDGAVGAPSLVMTDGAGVDDETTGWYRPSADTWAFALSGVQALLLGGNGVSIPGAFRLGVGSAPSATAAELLKVSRSGETYLTVQDSSTPVAARLHASGTLATLFTSTSHSLQLGYGGASGTALRAVLSSTGVDLRDSGGNVVLVTDTAAELKVGASGGKLSFYSGTPQSKITVSGTAPAEQSMKDLLQALEDLGLITDDTT